MRLTLFLLSLLSLPAFAAPVTYTFQGEVTSITIDGGDSIDPHTPLLRSDGAIVFNGDPGTIGKFTADLDNIPAPYNGVPLPLNYQFSMEGATYYAVSSKNYFNAMTSTPETLYWHQESIGLTNDGGISSLIQTFTFNFENGVFTGGTFKLDDMADRDLGIYGMEIRGVITSLTEVPEVPIPAAAWLFGTSLITLAAARRRNNRQ